MYQPYIINDVRMWRVWTSRQTFVTTNKVDNIPNTCCVCACKTWTGDTKCFETFHLKCQQRILDTSTEDYKMVHEFCTFPQILAPGCRLSAASTCPCTTFRTYVKSTRFLPFLSHAHRTVLIDHTLHLDISLMKLMCIKYSAAVN